MVNLKCPYCRERIKSDEVLRECPDCKKRIVFYSVLGSKKTGYDKPTLSN